MRQYQVALDAGKVTYNKRYNNGSFGATKGFVLIDVDGLDFANKSNYIVKFWGERISASFWYGRLRTDYDRADS